MAISSERHSVVVRVFEDRTQAVVAVRDLYQAGFREDEIGIARQRADGDLAEAETVPEEGGADGTESLTVTFAGSSLDGIVGLGITAGVMPAVGPVVAGGTLAAIVANEAEDDVLLGALGALSGDAYPRDEARFYEDQLGAGRTVVAVNADDRYDDAAAILAQDGGYDIEPRASSPSAVTATREATAKSEIAEGVAPNPSAHECD